MHAEAFAFVKQAVAGLTPRYVVEIGSYNVNGSVRELLPHVEHYVGVDIRPGPGVDVVADGAKWQPPEPPDAVLCCEVLEHVPPEKQAGIVDNAWRMLTPAGLLIVTCATNPRPPHTWDGRDGTEGGYWNVLPTLFRPVLAEAETADERIDRTRGDYYLAARTPARMLAAA